MSTYESLLTSTSETAAVLFSSAPPSAGGAAALFFSGPPPSAYIPAPASVNTPEPLLRYSLLAAPVFPMNRSRSPSASTSPIAIAFDRSVSVCTGPPTPKPLRVLWSKKKFPLRIGALVHVVPVVKHSCTPTTTTRRNGPAGRSYDGLVRCAAAAPVLMSMLNDGVTPTGGV